MTVEITWKNIRGKYTSQNVKCDHITWGRASLVAQMVNKLPATQETGVQSLGREDPLEKGMATHSSTLAWRIHGQGSLVGYSP